MDRDGWKWIQMSSKQMKMNKWNHKEEDCDKEVMKGEVDLQSHGTSC